ncbi:TasA family protein [Nocardioides sp. AX2bis]|uniref:TasA family protein n=1 Tax=Nocardioides sp. AX2bis TaxID=2653157 RepID=UPI0012F02D0C|nr:TasA family protein [Nocardioides sp. AX2bis]VXB96467.1 conserved hypothetical protein [Nocardioides sp. AX2bis]
MSSHRAERPHGRRLGRGPLVVLSVTAALGSVTSIGTYAFWNDTATVAGATITSGTLDLKVNDADNLPTWTPFSMTNMAPGESRAAVLTLRNTSPTPFTVAATGSATGADLQPVMVVRVVVGASATVDTSYPRTEACTGGTQVYNAILPAGTPAQVLPAPPVVAPGVNNGAPVDVCVQATLPNTPAVNQNALQGKTWVPTFVFTATQS